MSLIAHKVKSEDYHVLKLQLLQGLGLLACSYGDDELHWLFVELPLKWRRSNIGQN